MTETKLLDNKTILVTGGTGSFGHQFIAYVLTHYKPKKIIVYSRDEFKQFVMSNESPYKENAKIMRFFIGDVRDKERLERAMEGVDYVVHAAALKQVPACEYNPAEAIKTNVHGAMNVIDACLDQGVRKAVALSTDKAVNPVNLYGGTKLVSDKLFIAANAYAGSKDVAFSIVRYGNVAGSRGSVIPYFRKLLAEGETVLPITDYRMTRFWISLEEGVKLVIKALEESAGGETFISRIPSFYVKDLAEALQPGVQTRESGIRPGEKLHEVMVTAEDAPNTLEFEKNFIVFPQMVFNERQKEAREKASQTGRPVEDGFVYSSGTNSQWLTVEEIRERLKNVKED